MITNTVQNQYILYYADGKYRFTRLKNKISYIRQLHVQLINVNHNFIIVKLYLSDKLFCNRKWLFIVLIIVYIVYTFKSQLMALTTEYRCEIQINVVLKLSFSVRNLSVQPCKSQFIDFNAMFSLLLEFGVIYICSSCFVQELICALRSQADD